MKKGFIFGILVAMFTTQLFCVEIDRSKVVKNWKEVSYDTNEEIMETIWKIQKRMVDVTGDGEINCQDHAILFYLVWTTYVDCTPGNCLIVRNDNPNPAADFNHLFAIVKDRRTGKWIEVEPFTHCVTYYLMTECWPRKRYDPTFNLYNETEYWLKKRTVPGSYEIERYKYKVMAE